MPKGPSSQQLQEWYKKFSEILLKNADIDVNTPEDLAFVKNFQITKWDTTNPETPDVKIDYAYASQNGNDSAVPYSTDAKPSQHDAWMNENLKPAVTNEQILRLYNMSREGTLMITGPGNNFKNIQMIRTDLSGRITLSQPINVYRNAGNENLPEQDRIPQFPVKPAFSLNPEDYNIPAKPAEPAKPANMHPGFWSWLGYLFGRDTDYAKLKRYEQELEAYQEELAQWEQDLDEKQSYTVTDEITNETKDVAYDEYRLARYEHQQYSQKLEVFKADPMGKFNAIANSAAKLAKERFWNSEQVSAQSNFHSTPRGKAVGELNDINKRLVCEDRTDSWLHNWFGHDGIPSKVNEWDCNFRLDNLQLKQIDLPKAPNFNQMTAAQKANHIKDMSNLFDLAAISAIIDPEVTGKNPLPGRNEFYQAQSTFSHMFNDMVTSGRDNPTGYFKHIEPAREKALDVMTSYSNGEKGQLAELLGRGLRQMLVEGTCLHAFTEHALNTCYMISKLYNTMKKDPDLLQASGLNEDELQQVQAHVELYQIMRKGLQAKKDLLGHALEKHTLSPENLKQAAQDVLIFHSVILGVHDDNLKNIDALHRTQEYIAVEESFTVPVDENDPSKGKKMVDAATFEIIKNKLNILDSNLPTNEFTMRLRDENWVKQYTQTILKKADISKVGDMSRTELRDLFSKKNEEIFSSLMPSSNLDVQKQNAPTLEVEKKPEAVEMIPG